MNTDMTYILEINLYLLLFAAAYFVFFKNLTFFKINRFIIIGLVISACLIPFIQMPSISVDANFFTFQLDEVLIGQGSATSSASSGFHLWEFLGVLYIAGAVGTFLFLVIQLIFTFRLVANGRKSSTKVGTEVYTTDQRTTASFFRFLFWSCEPETEHIPWIREHEAVHMRELHSADVIFLRLVRIFCWFNPAIYLLEKAMETNHEFRADEVVAKRFNDKYNYSRVLLSEAFGINEKILAHHFAKSNLLKSRIMMLNKSKSKNSSVAKYLLVLPILCAGLLFHACTEDKSDVTQPAGTNTITTVDAPVPGEKIPGTDIYKVVEKMPEYPGGMGELMAFLGENIKYPADAKEDKEEGTVFLQFVIGTDGSVTEIVQKPGQQADSNGPDQRLVEAAIEVVSQMPDWIPGEHEGQKVKVQYVLPIKYQLE